MSRVMPTLRFKFHRHTVNALLAEMERIDNDGGVTLSIFVKDFIELAKKIAGAMSAAEIPEGPQSCSAMGALAVWGMTQDGLTKDQALELIGAAYGVLWEVKA